MFDCNKIDAYFNGDSKLNISAQSLEQRHTKLVRLAKLLLPVLAALLIGLLLLIPSIKNDLYDFKIDITKPKSGELEKLHVENSVFNITDQNNQVHNFVAQNIDETKPGSKIIKLTNPEGTIPNENQEWINIKSPTGFYNQDANTLRLEDGVEIFYSSGMNINLKDFNYDFKTQSGNSSNPISGQGVYGNIKSESFEYFKNDSLLIFKGKTYITIREDSFESRN